jgi:L-lactate dehydrogenase complex protein LldG
VSGARAAILDRIERALRTARIPSVLVESGHGPTSPTPGPPDGTPQERQGDRDPKALLDRFLLEARALGVEAFVEGSVASVRERLAAIVGTRRVLSWNPERLPYDAGAIVAGACLGSAPLHEQADAEIGVTGCDAAIAETGSLVLLSAAGTATTVSLLPPVHVALVRPQDLCFSMGAFFETSAARMAAATSCTVVTGPSRTADIELSLTIGVHGPGRVVVIVGPRDDHPAVEDTEEREDTKEPDGCTRSSELAS